MHPTPHTRQHGGSLIEVLIAFIVVCLSFVGAQRLQSGLRLHADTARQRSEAVRLSQQEIERLRAAAPTPASTAASGTNTHYTLQTELHPQGDLALRTTTLHTRWLDRSGTAQQVTLHTATSTTSPRYAAALTLPVFDAALGRPRGREGGIPPGAKDLGDGRSVYKPRERGAMALVFDTTTGEVVSRCRVGTQLSTRQLGIEHLQECDRIRGSLVSGHVRFALGATPDPRQANDEPLPLGVRVQFSGPSSGPADCEAQPMKTVRVTRGDVVKTEAVPLDMTAAALEAAHMQELGERFTAFTCLIVDARWSGQLVFEPRGWSLGLTAGEHRICRVGNAHAEGYREASGALRQQNFVVLRGDQPCPAEPSQPSSHNHASASLSPHQP